MSRLEYTIALQFVRQHYGDLYKHAAAVVLTPAKMFPPGQTGQCSHDNFISISDEHTTVGAYVDTLVHELTHAQQNALDLKLTDQQREEQAYQAGIEAAQAYLIKAAPWRRGQ